MVIERQVKLFNDINIMPFLRNFIRFLNSNLTNLSTPFLIASCYSFKFVYSNTKHSKYSFSNIKFNQNVQSV